MRPLADPERWAAGLAGSHTLAVRITAVQSGRQITSGLSGKVTLDSTADIRGRLDLTIVDQTGDLVPEDPTDDLAPYGQELYVERGIQASGWEEPVYVGLGVYRIEDVQVEDSGDGFTIQIAGLDRSAKMAEAKFLEAFSVAAGTDAVTEITKWVHASYPGIETNFAGVSKALPLLALDEQQDPWDLTAKTIAYALGMELFFDGDGIPTLRPVSSPTQTPVAELAEGEDGILLPPLTRHLTRQGTFNYWIVTGENPENDEVYRAVAVDNDPSSPTRFGGPFGSVPSFNSFDVASQASAQDAANGLKAKGMGISRSINFNAVPNPALEPGDVVTIRRERSGVNESHILDSLSFGLGAEAMSGQTRTVISNAS